MMFERLRLINKNQRGFTLIEVIIAVAITGIIIGGITMSITQMFVLNARTTSRMVVIHQVQNSAHWIGRDALMAQHVVVTTAGLFPIQFIWIEWDGTKNTVIYTIIDRELRRSHSQDPGQTTETMVARFIDPAGTSASFDGRVLTFTVTAAVGDHRETGVHKIMPRSAQ